MRTSSRLGRTLVFTCSAGLVSVLAMIPSGSAFAGVTGSFMTIGSATSTPTSGNMCTVIAGSNSSTSPTKAVVGGKVKASTNLNATFQSSTDTSDLTTVSGHYTGVVDVAKKHGDLSRLTLTGTGSVSVQRAEGNASHCKTTADVGSEIMPMSFTESHGGWFLAHRVGTPKSEVVELAVANSAATSGVIIDIYEGGPSSADARAFAKPGTYGATALVATSSSVLPLKAANRTSVSLAFYRTGAAPSGTSGTGKKFVRFPSSVSCAHHSARLTWTGKAGQVTGASFFLNGHKLATVNNPKAGHSVVLRHLAKAADNKIVAKVKLNGGGRASTTRTYLGCKG
jgi:hypothetical protein